MTHSARLPLMLLVALFVAYGGLYIHRTSFVVDGTRYWCLFDDAMISMTYARTFAGGHGLVWHPGAERVEGFTNLLWTLYMAALHHLPVPAHQLSLLVQLTALALLALNLLLVYKLAQRLMQGLAPPAPGPVVPLLAAGLVAFYQPLVMWSLQGMEVAALAPLVTGSLLLASDPGRGLPRLWALYLLLGLGTLLRPDAAVLLVSVSLFLIVGDRERRGVHLLLAALSALVFIGGQTGFRLAYYDSVFPNTYYLKMTGYPMLLRVTRGLLALAGALVNTSWLLCLLPVGLLLLKPGRPVKLVLWVCAAQAAYSAYAGGDAWEWTGGANRYLVIVMPGLLTLLAAALVRVWRALAHRWDALHPNSRWRPALSAGAVVLVLLVMADLSMPANLQPGQEWPLLTEPLYRTQNRSLVQQALLIREITAPEARVGLIWAGTIAYYTQRPVVDLLGKSDRSLARLKVSPEPGLRRFWRFHPGHMKWDMAYTLTSQRPDFLPLLFPEMVRAAGPALHRDYESAELDGLRVWWRKGSPHVRSALLQRLQTLPAAASSVPSQTP